MARVAAAEFPAQLRVEAHPEAAEIRGGLDGPLVRGEQMDHERDGAAGDAGAFLHAEKILQAGGDPRGFPAFIVHFRRAAGGEFQARRGDLFEGRGVELSFERPDETGGVLFHFGETAEAETDIG